MQLAVLGAGQIGGSFAAAIKHADEMITVHAYDPMAVHLDYLLQQGVIDYAASSPVKAVANADIILFSCPLSSYQPIAHSIAPHLKPGAIVTDVGSVKSGMWALAPLLPAARIVPAHPIAGTEKSGALAMNADLFRNKLCILTPTPQTDAQAIAAIETLWHCVGSDTMHMPAEVHDQVYAHVSHLPHFIAFITADFYAKQQVVLEQNDIRVQKFLRIAHSDPRMWADIALANREALLAACATLTAVLTHVISELETGEQGTHNPHAITALLPRVIASTLVSSIALYERQCGMNLKAFAGAGLRDMIAPAMQSPQADMEAISNAAGTVAALLHGWLAEFHAFTNCIGAEDATAIFSALCTMRRHADTLSAHSKQ